MTGFTRIPEKIEKIDLISEIFFELDTKGHSCIVKAQGCNIYVSLKPDKKNRFIIREGEELDFCGKVYLSSDNTAEIYCLFYKTL